MSTICTSECVNCIHGTLDNSNKSKVKIICAVKEREYYYGQRINCEDFIKANKKGWWKMDYSTVVDLDNVTLEDCLRLFLKNSMIVVIGDGRIINFQNVKESN